MRLAYALAMRLLCAEIRHDAPLLACGLVRACHLNPDWCEGFGLTEVLKQLGVVNALLNTPPLGGQLPRGFQ